MIGETWWRVSYDNELKEDGETYFSKSFSNYDEAKKYYNNLGRVTKYLMYADGVVYHSFYLMDGKFWEEKIENGKWSFKEISKNS